MIYQSDVPSMTDLARTPSFSAYVRRDVLLAYRRLGDTVAPLIFFSMVCALVPLGLSPDPQRLSEIAPGIMWIMALLATLLSIERIFAFDYQDFAREFNKTRRRLRIKKLVPYQARHSGVSIDLCLGYRSIAEAKNRGRWASEKSMLRYNKSAKLAQVLKQFDARQLDYFRACESRLEALFFGQAKAEDLQLP